MYCPHCGAKTDVRKARCPVCFADQRKRRVSFFSLLAVALACAMFAGVLLLGSLLQNEPAKSDALTVPAAEAAQDAAADPASDETVFVTHAGAKYHRDGCAYLNDTKERIPLAEALRMGYEPCAACFPDEAQPAE